MAEHKTLFEKLEKASISKKRSLRSQFEDIYEQVEKAISSGVSHEIIVGLLNDDGFTITLKSFRNVLARVRKKHNYQAIKTDSKKSVLRSDESKPTNPKTSLFKSSIQEIKKTTNEIDLDDLTKIGRQRMRNKLKENKK